MKRLEYIDIMRGVAILLVVFEHCIGSLQDNTAAIILSFHMPLFFFISGCCFSNSGMRVGKYIMKKIKQLLVPQITLTLITLCSIYVIDVILTKKMSLSDISFGSLFGYWFLPVLFFMYVLMFPIVSLIKSRRTIINIAFALYVVFLITEYNGITYVQQTLCALVFGFMGYLIRPYLDKYLASKSLYKGLGWVSLLLCAIISFYNEPVGMYINQYGNKFLFTLTSVLGIFFIFDISVSLRNSLFLQWCGRESIIIYVMQFLVVRIVMALLSSIVPGFFYSIYPFYIITFLTVLVILVPIVWFSDRYLRWAFGKKSRGTL